MYRNRCDTPSRIFIIMHRRSIEIIFHRNIDSSFSRMLYKINGDTCTANDRTWNNIGGNIHRVQFQDENEFSSVMKLFMSPRPPFLSGMKHKSPRQ